MTKICYWKIFKK